MRKQTQENKVSFELQEAPCLFELTRHGAEVAPVCSEVSHLLALSVKYSKHSVMNKMDTKPVKCETNEIIKDPKTYIFYFNFTSYGSSKHIFTCSKWGLNHDLPLWSSQTWRLSVRLPHSAPCSAYCSRPAERGSSPSAESLSLLTPACNRGTEWRLWPFVFLIGSLKCLHFTLWQRTVS